MSVSNPNPLENRLRLIQCHIGDEIYGLDMAWVHSIQRTERLQRIDKEQGNSSDLIGWLPTTEKKIPVYSLGRWLKTKFLLTSSQRIVVLKAKPHLWGVVVDRVSQVIPISANWIEPMPPVTINPEANYFRGVIRLDEKLLLFLSPEHLPPSDTNVDPNAESDSGSVSTLAEAQNPLPKPKTNLSKTQNGKGTPAQSKTQGQMLIFSLPGVTLPDNSLSFGVSLSQVPEVLEPLPFIPVPTAPSFVLGLVNWRNHPLPVIDLAARLGLPAQTDSILTERTRLMIVRNQGHAQGGLLTGFLVRPNIRIVNLPLTYRAYHQTLPLDPTFVHGVVELKNEILAIPDLRAILSSRQDGIVAASRSENNLFPTNDRRKQKKDR